VFLHGVIANGDHWRKVAPPLSERGFRCVVPDLPLGSHRTPMSPAADLTPVGLAKTVDAFLPALDLSEVTLIGNDTGGAIAQLVITRHPDRIGKLVLTPCDAFDVFPPSIFKYLVWLAKAPGAVWMTAQTMRIRPLRRAPFAYGWLAKRPIDRDVSDGYLEPLLKDPGIRRDAAKVLSAIDPRYTVEAARRLGEFSRPVLLAWATEDRVFPFRLAERLRPLFPNATLEAIEDSYAFVPEDRPDRLVELVAPFAARA
jgi:pimeloyl-ACP methyl ester carboxylesterase